MLLPLVHAAEDKVALILSVARYNSFRSLPAVYYDIIETTRKLESLHFKVLSFLDLTLEEMMKALQLFQSLLGRGVYGEPLPPCVQSAREFLVAHMTCIILPFKDCCTWLAMESFAAMKNS